MMEDKKIVLNGTEYVPLDSAKVISSEIKIICVQASYSDGMKSVRIHLVDNVYSDQMPSMKFRPGDVIKILKE